MSLKLWVLGASSSPYNHTIELENGNCRVLYQCQGPLWQQTNLLLSRCLASLAHGTARVRLVRVGCRCHDWPNERALVDSNHSECLYGKLGAWLLCARSRVRAIQHHAMTLCLMLHSLPKHRSHSHKHRL